MGMYDSDEETDLVKRLRKEIEDRDKVLKQRDTELAGYRAKESQRAVAETFQARGVNPALARFALTDLGDDVTPERVGQWIDENGSLFGVQQAQPPAQEQQQLPPEQADPYRRMAAVEQAAQPGIPGDAYARVDAAETEDEVWAAVGGRPSTF